MSSYALAEDKFSTDIVPKLTAEETKNAPELVEGDVYPVWGVPCTNFTYHVTYKDKEGRDPEYVRINLNGQWHEMQKGAGDYKNGVVYTYNLVPDSGKQLFYYYEASNGKGKARTSIIDSPDQGPVLFSEKLDNNQILLLDKDGKEIWNYEIGRDWVEGVALSSDGNYVAAVTNINIHLFSRESKTPLWTFCINCELPAVVLSNMAGIAISANGSYIAGTQGGKLYFFRKESKEPVWSADIESGAIGVDMSNDGGVIAVGVANAESGRGDKIFIFNKEGEKLLEYKPIVPTYEDPGNFYRPDVTPDGKFISFSTGCPDRKAYLFSATDLIFRSEQLTQDSPVHKSAISDDGSLIAYSADHSTGKEIVFLFNNLGKKLWSFSSQEDSTARAVSISADGNYLAAGTSAGHVYLFSKDSNIPKWKFSDKQYFAQFGEVKLNSDGSLLAAGGTTKKVYLFSRNSNQPLWQYQTNTWITKLDFNGEYILAGTGPREYFFEGKSLTDEKVTCKEIIQPPAMNLGMDGGSTSTINFCGDNICEGPETKESCPQDCNSEFSQGSSLGGDTWCGNDLCESPIETKENCAEDCSLQGAGDDNVDENTRIDNAIIKKQDEGKNFFSVIIDFFSKLFGYRESAKQIMEDTEGGKKVYVDGKEVPYKTENEVQPGTPMRVIETETGEKVYVESLNSSGKVTIIKTTGKDGRVFENTVATDVK